MNGFILSRGYYIRFPAFNFVKNYCTAETRGKSSPLLSDLFYACRNLMNRHANAFRPNLCRVYRFWATLMNYSATFFFSSYVPILSNQSVKTEMTGLVKFRGFSPIFGASTCSCGDCQSAIGKIATFSFLDGYTWKAGSLRCFQKCERFIRF